MRSKPELPAKSNGLPKQIQKANVEYKYIVENNSFCILKTDLQGNYTYMNPFYCKLLGFAVEDFLGKNSLIHIIPEDHALCRETVDKCLSEPNRSHWVNLRKPLPNGEIYTQWEFTLMEDQDGKPFEILCVGHDITPLMVKQKELQALMDVTAAQNKRLINFNYIVSHNIRSHVANIIGILNMSDLIESEEENKLAWNLLRDSAKNLDQTLYNLNDVISIQSYTNLPISEINVNSEIQQIVKSLQLLVDQAETTINYNFGIDEIVTSNPAYFESIFLNLLTNSIKYKSPKRPLEINIGMFEDGEYKAMTFKDNGLGIDLERYKDELFGMYKIFHGNKDARGLGLFIIKTQIEAMNGKIEVDSEVGVGTTFTLFFPKREQ